MVFLGGSGGLATGLCFSVGRVFFLEAGGGVWVGLGFGDRGIAIGRDDDPASAATVRNHLRLKSLPSPLNPSTPFLFPSCAMDDDLRREQGLLLRHNCTLVRCSANATYV